jgi:plastocyanin
VIGFEPKRVWPRNVATAGARCLIGCGVALIASAAGIAAAPVAVSAAAAQPRVVVVVRDYAIVPNSITVAPGTLVVWANNGAATHRIVDDGGAFGSPGLQPGHDFGYRYTTAGRFPFHCTIHAQMVGTVIVAANAAAPALQTTHDPTSPPPSANAAATAPQQPTTLAMTGGLSATLVAWACVCLLLGAIALTFGRKPAVVIPALVGRKNNDDLLPVKDRVRR